MNRILQKRRNGGRISSSIERIGLVVRCLLYVVFHGRAVRRGSSHPRSIAVFNTAKLGDMICATPIFRALKTSFPEATITVIGDGVNKQVLKNHPYVDDYIVWDRSNKWSMLSIIREHSFDTALSVSQNFTGLAILILAGIPLISAFRIGDAKSPSETPAYKVLLYCVSKVTVGTYCYAPRENLRLLEPLGIHTTDTTKIIGVDPADYAEADHLLADVSGLLVGIAPSAGSKIKEWPIDRFAMVADYLSVKYGASIVLIGGPADVEQAKAMRVLMDSRTRVIDTVGLASIGGLKGLVGRLGMMIAVDTGPIYVAEALGIPTIDILGAVDERVQPPRGHLNLVVFPPRERAELFVTTCRVYDFTETRRQFEATTVAMVNEAVDLLMERIGVS